MNIEFEPGINGLLNETQASIERRLAGVVRGLIPTGMYYDELKPGEYIDDYDSFSKYFKLKTWHCEPETKESRFAPCEVAIFTVEFSIRVFTDVELKYPHYREVERQTTNFINRTVDYCYNFKTHELNELESEE